MCHEAYEEALATAGVPLGTFFADHGVIVPVSKSEATYLRSLVCGDKLRIEVTPTLLTENSYALDYVIWKTGTVDKRAAVARTDMKRNPFHPFSSFDTATLGGVAFGPTVLSRAVIAAGFEWDPAGAHSAIYDAQRTAEVFCAVCNRFRGIYEEAAARGPAYNDDATEAATDPRDRDAGSASGID